jgi:hypothetical protein
MRRASTIAVLLLLVVTIVAQQESVVIRRGAVGPVSIGASEQDIVGAFPADRRKAIDLRLEGELTPALELTLPGSKVTGGIIAELRRRAGRDEVWRIWVKDPAARTAKGVGVGSTVGELRAAYRLAWVSWGEGHLYIRVEELGASFEIDPTGFDAGQVTVNRDPSAVPDRVKIVGLLLTTG